MTAPPPDTRAPYPKGRPYQLTDTWKLAVDRWLAENGKTRQWLAREIPADPSTVLATLNPVESDGSATSKLVPRICEITGLPPPVRETGEGWEDGAIEVLAALSPEDRHHVLETAERILRAKKAAR